ncbi:hypothetical protein [Mariniflexile sp.]|uniref:hypothetical protein n=1 Tax=Mariniflexile sp. TaxID=1979402 RepID=UPI00356643D4
MPHILKNQHFEIQIDFPLEHYTLSRFDWTGKISSVKYKGIPISSVESRDSENEDHFGKGFYNEFGIDKALGFEAADIGGWFHKMGVGLLKKDSETYNFAKSYEIKPAEFKVITKPNKVIITCTSEAVNGYSYVLKKEISVLGNQFSISYELQNTGRNDIITDEYVHNFTLINTDLIDPSYILKFPFQIYPEHFEETVNPENKVLIGQNDFKFKGEHQTPFFFSNLSGDKTVTGGWTLVNRKSNLAISETTNFKTNKVNLWGCNHVVSPELFININVKPGEVQAWTRTYKVFDL